MPEPRRGILLRALNLRLHLGLAWSRRNRSRIARSRTLNRIIRIKTRTLIRIIIGFKALDLNHITRFKTRNPIRIVIRWNIRSPVINADVEEMILAGNPREVIMPFIMKSVEEWGQEFRNFVKFFTRRKYSFECLDDISCDDADLRKVYIRYDVHLHDLKAAYALAYLHEKMKIPGVFCITWDFTVSEFVRRKMFAFLQHFDSRYVKFGLHTDPFAA